MPELKISYFDVAGRAEMSRLALHIGGIPFTDDRFKREAWAALKPQTPYGGAPTLSVDGRMYAQSNAILRYCGKQAGLYPSDDERALQVDEIIDVFQDVGAALFRSAGAGEEAVRAAREAFVKDSVPRFFGGLEKRLETFGDGPWAVGGEISIADLAIAGACGYLTSGMLDHLPTDLLDGFDRIQKVLGAVDSHPAVVEWRKEHK